MKNEYMVLAKDRIEDFLEDVVVPYAEEDVARVAELYISNYTHTVDPDIQWDCLLSAYFDQKLFTAITEKLYDDVPMSAEEGE